MDIENRKNIAIVINSLRLGGGAERVDTAVEYGEVVPNKKI
jgi:hypothetical protein